MEKNIIVKTGDLVPAERNDYFIVEKPFVKTETTDEDEDYSFYKVGDPIVIRANCLKAYVSSFQEFVNNNCRKATSREISTICAEFYSNACVGTVYKEGNYQVNFFYIVESHYDEILAKFDVENENCFWAVNRELEELISKLCESEFTIVDIFAGFYKRKLFLYTRFDEKIDERFLKICRKATSDEAKELALFVKEMEDGYYKKIKDKQRKEEEAKQKIYEANKSNAEYFPGSCGNYKQVLVEAGKKVIPEKEYTLAQIKAFYSTLLGFKGLSDDVRNSIIFYGGTIPYILCDEHENTRKFGDVDIFLPVSMMQKFRDELQNELDYIYDSTKLTRKVKLTAKGFQIKMPLDFWYSEYESYLKFEKRMKLAEMEAQKNAVYQDYGFKAKLFGINISVFPLYDWKFEDGSIGVCAKSFRISKEEGDWNFLLNTIVSKGITIDEFCNEVRILGYDVKVAKIEYTMASKRNAIRFGYVLRKETDETDLKYIESHSSELDIKESQVKMFMENIPDYGISYVYRITRAGDAVEMSPEAYKHVVTRNDKPS